MGEESVDALEQEILSESEARANGAVERAERIVQRVKRNASRRAEEIRREAQQKLAPRIENEKARAMAVVDLEAKRQEASAREDLVATAFREARDELEKWRSLPNRGEILSRLVREGVKVLPGGSFTVEVDGQDVEVLEALVGRLSAEMSSALGRQIELSVRSSCEPILGGARVTAHDGRSQVDQTFEARLARVAPDLRRELHREIFASAAGSERHSS